MNRASGLVLFLLIAGSGCTSATKHIDQQQALIEHRARASIEQIEQSIGLLRDAIGSDTGIGDGALNVRQSIRHQESVLANQHRIIEAAARTRARLPDIQDRVPPLVRLAQTWGSVAVIGAILATLAYLGVGPLIRRCLQFLGLLIPRAVRSDAKFDAEAVACGRACDLDYQRIAARRAVDRCYDRAFQCEKKRWSH